MQKVERWISVFNNWLFNLFFKKILIMVLSIDAEWLLHKIFLKYKKEFGNGNF